jgi:tetratricopeptide (TPR) repeat protein
MQLIHETARLGHFEAADRWVEHARAAVSRRRSPDSEIRLAYFVGTYHLQKGDFVDASEEYKRGLALVEAMGEDPLEAPYLEEGLGNALRGAGDSSAAAPHYERAVAKLEAMWPPTHPSLASPLHNLGSCHLESGNLTKARELLERSLAIVETHQPGHREHIAGTLVTLASVEDALHNEQRALDLAGRAVSLLEQDGDNVPLARVCLLHGQILRRAGHSDEAHDAAVRGFTILEGQLGWAHPHTREGANILADVLRSRGELERAHELYSAVLENDPTSVGDENSSHARHWLDQMTQ